MTTIGNYAVDLTLNASGLFKNADLARGEFRSLGNAANKLRTDFEREDYILQRMVHGYQSLGEKSAVLEEIIRRQTKVRDEARPKTEREIELLKQQEAERARLNQQEKDAIKNRELLMTPQQQHASRRAELYEQFRRNLLLRSEYDELVKLSAQRRDSELVDKKTVATQEKLNSVMSKHRTELQRLKDDLAFLTSAQGKKLASDQQLAVAIGNVSNKIKEEEERLTRLNSKTSESAGLVSSLSRRFVGFMAAKFTVSSISNLVRDADKANIELSRTEAILGAISGSKFAGSQLIDDLRNLSKQMPLSIKDSAEGAKNLIAYGMSTKEVIPVIKSIGMITAGNSERFKNLANAIAQMRGANRLMGQEVIQAVNAGWNPLAEISRNTGKSILVLKKEMEEGKLGFDLVTQALQSATTGMGRFANVAGDVMTTVAGKQQLLTARWEENMARMGKAIEPLSIAWKEFLTFGIERTTTLIESIVKLGDTMAAQATKAAGTQKFSMSELFFGDISSIGAIKTFTDAMRFEALGGFRGEFFGQGDKANREDAIKKMSQNVELMKLVGEMKGNFLNQEKLSNINIAAYNMYLKRQTEEKEKQKQIADMQAAKEKQQQQVSLEQMKTKEISDQKFETMLNKLKLQTEELTRGKIAADMMKADMAGFTAEQRKQVELASKQLEQAKKKAELDDKAAKAQQRFDDLLAKYRKKTETNIETAAREIKDINTLVQMQKLSLQEAAEIKKRIIQGTAEAEFGKSKNISSSPPKALVQGSAEAVNAVLGKMREPTAIQIAQLNEQKQQKQAIKDVEKAIKNLEGVKVKR